MATQSLDRLNEMSESGSMRETILANSGCLMVFQVQLKRRDAHAERA